MARKSQQKPAQIACSCAHCHPAPPRPDSIRLRLRITILSMQTNPLQKNARPPASPLDSGRFVTGVFRQVLDALRTAGWKVTKRAGNEAYYTTPGGRESTIALVRYSPSAWRWSLDLLTVRRRGRSELVVPSAPPSCIGDTELSCAPEELAALAVWLPAWMLAREAREPLPDLPVPWEHRHGEGPGSPFVGGYAWSTAGRAAHDAASRRPTPATRPKQ